MKNSGYAKHTYVFGNGFLYLQVEIRLPNYKPCTGEVAMKIVNIKCKKRQRENTGPTTAGTGLHQQWQQKQKYKQ